MERGQALFTISIDRIEPSEHREFVKVVRRHLGSYVTNTYFFLLIACAVLLVWVFHRDPLSAGIFLVAVALYMSYSAWLERRRRQKALEETNLNLPAQFTFMENGIAVQSVGAEGFRLWQSYEGYVETGKTFTLGTSTQRHFALIPKRSLDASTLVVLKDLLQTKLKKFI